MVKQSILPLLVGIILTSVCSSNSTAAIIGVDNRYPGIGSSFASSASFDEFRAELSNGGNTLVPLSSFLAADLSGLDAIVLNQPYNGFGATPLSPQEIADIQSFVTGNFVAFTDTSMFADTGAGSDRDISFGDNRQLLTNSVNFMNQKSGSALFFGDGASGADPGNLNTLMAPFGVTYSDLLFNGSGITLSPTFVPHPVTQGVTTIGMDLRRLVTSFSSPAMDLTLETGTFDFIAAGTVTVPEPSTFAVIGLGMAVSCWLCRRKKIVQTPH